jgi:hypothetical protein
MGLSHLFPSLIHYKDEWGQLSRLQGAFPQGRGGKEAGRGGKEAGRGKGEAGRGTPKEGSGAKTAGRRTGETTEGTQPTDDFPRVHPTLPQSPLEATPCTNTVSLHDRQNSRSYRKILSPTTASVD